MSSSNSETNDTGEKLHSQPVRKLWTRQEDERLRLLVSYWGDQGGRKSNWDKIASNFENRSAKNCRKRWFHSLDPKLRRGKWNKNEDRILKEAYEQMGPAWQRISQLIPGRTDDQCAKRYNDVLNPAVQDRLRPWTPEEDELLNRLYEELGPKWQLISTKMTARTGLTIRNRFRKLHRPEKKPQSSNMTHQGDLGPTASHNSDSDALDNSSKNNSAEGDAVAYNVAGQNLNQGFPAGADANWYLGSHQNSSYLPSQENGYIPGTESPVENGRIGILHAPNNQILGSQQCQLTLTVEDPKSPALNFLQQTHHPISENQFNQIVNFAAKNGKQVIVHQHIYQTAQSNSSQSSSNIGSAPTQGQHIVVGSRVNSFQPYQDPQLLKAVQPPVQPPETNISTIPLPSSSRLGSNSDNSISHLIHPDHIARRESISRENHPHSTDVTGQLPSNYDALSEVYTGQGRVATQPPPDEFLSRPLVFEDAQTVDNRFDSSEIDFLAFNPS